MKVNSRFFSLNVNDIIESWYIYFYWSIISQICNNDWGHQQDTLLSLTIVLTWQYSLQWAVFIWSVQWINWYIRSGKALVFTWLSFKLHSCTFKRTEERWVNVSLKTTWDDLIYLNDIILMAISPPAFTISRKLFPIGIICWLFGELCLPWFVNIAF